MPTLPKSHQNGCRNCCLFEFSYDCGQCTCGALVDPQGVTDMSEMSNRNITWLPMPINMESVRQPYKSHRIPSNLSVDIAPPTTNQYPRESRHQGGSNEKGFTKL